MKEFAIYTGLRLLVFVATFAVVAGIWLLAIGSLNWFYALLIAFVVSGIASFTLLSRQREAFAGRVDARAARAVAAMNAKEDEPDERDRRQQAQQHREQQGHGARWP